MCILEDFLLPGINWPVYRAGTDTGPAGSAPHLVNLAIKMRWFLTGGVHAKSSQLQFNRAIY